MSCEGFRRQIIVLLVLLAWEPLQGGVAFALDPRKAITQYVHNVWTVEDGLPQNSILAITQTRDGYLWLGTWQGLVRFDGVRFTVFDSQNTSEIKSNYIYAFCEDREGNLWIGTLGGLLRLRDGKFTNYTTRDGLSSDVLHAIYEDRQGNLWIGMAGGGLNRFSEGKITGFTSKDGLAGDGVEAIYEDRIGNLWVGAWSGLNRFKDGQFTAYTAKEGLPKQTVFSIFEDREGGLWVGASKGLYRFKDGKFNRFTKKEGLSPGAVRSIFQDREGNIWVGLEGGGLHRFQDGKFTRFTIKDGLSHDTVWPIYEDREGSLWVGTWGGLNRFKDGILTVFTTKEGMSHDWTHSVYGDRAGNIWVGTYGGGLNRLKDGRFSHYTMKNILPNNVVNSIYGDGAGGLWLCGDGGGLKRFKDGKLAHYSVKDGLSSDYIASIYEDRAGIVWIGTHGAGLSHFKNGMFSRRRMKDGLSGDTVRLTYEDRELNLWVATDIGLDRLKDGKFSHYRIKNEPLAINSIYEDSEGALWMATRGEGLIRFKDEQFTHYTTREGLLDNTLTSALEDVKGNLWLGSFKGIFRVSKKELNEVAQGKLRVVASVAYGKADGMRGVECNSRQPSGWKGEDGKLWFPTVKGLVMIDPDKMKPNTLPPPVFIEQFILDQQPVHLGQEAKLPPGKRELEFHYTALSFLDPKKVQFKYKLEGYDRDWVEAGTRRVAYYTRLSPGPYRFRVTACNNDGVWNATGAAVEFYLNPRFYETRIFYLLCLGVAAIALFSLGVGVRHRRVKQLKMKAKEQEAFSRQLIDSQESERKRIADELHGDLGHDLIIAKNKALLGLKLTEDDSPAKHQFEEISAMTSQVLDGLREIAHNLRPHHLDELGLKDSLESMLETVAGSSEIRFSAEIDPIAGVFSKEAEMNLYRIVQEGVNNIVKHSGATEASVTLKCNGRLVYLTIQDNGAGFDSTPKTTTELRHRGFGLTGISERARMLGGVESIHSVPGQGTTIIITLTREDGRHAD